jgi:hypothetical protein
VHSEGVSFRVGPRPLVGLRPLVAAFSLLAVTRVAAADGDAATATVRLEVQALPDCTSREEVAARVAARSRRIRFDDDATGPTLRAVIAAGPRGGAVGELVIVQPDGRSSMRRLAAPSCAEATDAIALIIALTLDPAAAATAGHVSATTAGHPATTTGHPATATGHPATAGGHPAAAVSRTTATAGANESTATTTTSGTTASEPTRAPSVGPSVREPPPPRPPGPATTATAPAPPPIAVDAEPSGVVTSSPPVAVATQSRFGAGALGQAIFGPAPGALPGVGVYLIAAIDRDAPWSPAIVVSATRAWSGALIEPGGTAAFTFDAASLDACALRLHVAFFEARACATALYGRLAASGSETYSPASATRPFAAAGGAALLSVELGRVFELAGRVGAGASLIRDSFAFSPTVFHRTADLTVAAGLGLGVRFP